MSGGRKADNCQGFAEDGEEASAARDGGHATPYNAGAQDITWIVRT
ncbi:hypothetical protein [Erwinia pyrifoliae]|nr:hypothetical protein [Erwinia pyrifoliae]UWS29761.1 hypothetical protein NYP81_18235 [Erwinia pyrifoliae]UXK11308.1 hypothetical protein NYP80_13400 [Erwinia pyrifoliae]UXK12748.1 hypothetical protein NYP80_02300 [Erwinia pyrifoliae]